MSLNDEAKTARRLEIPHLIGPNALAACLGLASMEQHMKLPRQSSWECHETVEFDRTVGAKM